METFDGRAAATWLWVELSSPFSTRSDETLPVQINSPSSSGSLLHLFHLPIQCFESYFQGKTLTDLMNSIKPTFFFCFHMLYNTFYADCVITRY